MTSFREKNLSNEGAILCWETLAGTCQYRAPGGRGVTADIGQALILLTSYQWANPLGRYQFVGHLVAGCTERIIRFRKIHSFIIWASPIFIFLIAEFSPLHPSICYSTLDACQGASLSHLIHYHWIKPINQQDNEQHKRLWTLLERFFAKRKRPNKETKEKQIKQCLTDNTRSPATTTNFMSMENS